MTSERPIRIVFLADTHLGFDYPVRPRIQRRRRGLDFFANYQRVLDYAVSSRADLLVHGGDLFFRSRIPAKIVDLAYAPLLAFAKHGIPALIVPGNHERSELPTSLSMAHPNIHVFDRPRTFCFEVAGQHIAVAGFPCERKNVRDRFGDLLDATGWSKDCADMHLLCMHQTVAGAMVGPSNFTFRSGRDVIQPTDLPYGLDAVLSGHIHRRQVLTRLDATERPIPPVIYPGSIERTSFAEKDEPKGFYEILLDGGAGNGSALRKLTFHTLPARPMVDLPLDRHTRRLGLGRYIRSRVARMDPDAIVRFRCDDELARDLSPLLSHRYLRAILPASMNFQLSGDFGHRERKQ